ncbi:hypothetical protein M405DRAFT_218279 [Rhizopogon salebrosus TDB-379]|nr:hypothetical protein M405DRAFT_218279 [Rhizopogon salebrosus TDB-379]
MSLYLLSFTVDSMVATQFLAPSFLHPIHSPSSQATPQGFFYTDRHKNSRRTPASHTNIPPSATPFSFRTRLLTWWPVHATPLASFHILEPVILMFSPNSRQLAYTTWGRFQYLYMQCSTKCSGHHWACDCGTVHRKKGAPSPAVTHFHRNDFL